MVTIPDRLAEILIEIASSNGNTQNMCKQITNQ